MVQEIKNFHQPARYWLWHGHQWPDCHCNISNAFLFYVKKLPPRWITRVCRLGGNSAEPGTKNQLNTEIYPHSLRHYGGGCHGCPRGSCATLSQGFSHVANRIRTFLQEPISMRSCFSWCLGPESNRHGDAPQGILSPLRLPVPPPRLLRKGRSLTVTTGETISTKKKRVTSRKRRKKAGWPLG